MTTEEFRNYAETEGLALAAQHTNIHKLRDPHLAELVANVDIAISELNDYLTAFAGE